MTDAPDPSPTPAPVPAEPATATALPPENLTRGTLLALLIIPAGIVAWVIVWAIGFVAAIVGIGIAFGALALYRFGSGGRISFNGAVRISAIIVVTLVLAFIAGIVSDNVSYYSRALANGKFFEGLAATIDRAGGDLVINLLLLIAFAALGIFTVFRTAVTQRKQEQAATTVLPPAA
jgi:hypothetical protein